MTFQPLIPTVLTPVVVPVLPDPAAAIVSVAEALQPDLAQGFQIDALRLRLEMERAFGGSDATGAWDWKLAYEAGEVALVLCDQQSHGASPGFILEVFCPERKHFHSASPVCSRPQEMFRLPLRQRSASRKGLGTCLSRSVMRYCSS